MSNLSFLVSGTQYNGQNMVLSVDPFNPGSGHVLVVNKDPGNKYQLWETIDWLDGYVFQNVATGQILCAQGGDSPVTMVDKSQVGNHSIWTKGGGSWFALRPQYDDDQNLNVQGDGPYRPGTRVLTYTWSGGDPNEVWEIQPVPALVAA